MTNDNSPKPSTVRMYTGKIVTSNNYSEFSQSDRLFWQKAHKAFLQGKTKFRYRDTVYSVPIGIKLA